MPSTQVGPPRLYSVDEEIANVRGQSQLPDFLGYAGLSEEGKRAYRDSLITGRMYAIDLEFSNYEIELTQERQSIAAGGDLASAALASAVPLVTGVRAKDLLAAASAITTSGKAIYSNDILFSKTIQILQTQMEATRAHIAAQIKSRLGSPASLYTLAAALSDLEDYYRAGTLTGALSDVSSTVSGDAEQAKQEKAAAIPVNLRPLSSSQDRLPPIQPPPRFAGNGSINSIEAAMTPARIAGIQAALCIGQTGVFDSSTRTAIGTFFSAYASISIHHFAVQPSMTQVGVTRPGTIALNALVNFASGEPLVCHDNSLMTAAQIGRFIP